MLGSSYVIGPRNAFHGSLGFNMGYYEGSGNKGLGFVPLATIGYDRVELCFTGSPKAGSGEREVNGKEYPATAMVAMFLKVTLYEWN